MSTAFTVRLAEASELPRLADVLTDDYRQGLVDIGTPADEAAAIAERGVRTMVLQAATDPDQSVLLVCGATTSHTAGAGLLATNARMKLTYVVGLWVKPEHRWRADLIAAMANGVLDLARDRGTTRVDWLLVGKEAVEPALAAGGATISKHILTSRLPPAAAIDRGHDPASRFVLRHAAADEYAALVESLTAAHVDTLVSEGLPRDDAEATVDETLRQPLLKDPEGRYFSVTGLEDRSIGAFVGAAVISVTPGWSAAQGMMLWLEPAYRGHASLARRLVRRGEAEARARGASSVQLGVADANPRLRRLYERLGYVSMARVMTQPVPAAPPGR